MRQASAGIYSWLPLGFRVLKRIEQIVREEQDRAGCQEMLMKGALWRKGRTEEAMRQSFQPYSSHPQAIKKQMVSKGRARGEQGESVPPALPLLCPCSPLALPLLSPCWRYASPWLAGG